MLKGQRGLAVDTTQAECRKREARIKLQSSRFVMPHGSHPTLELGPMNRGLRVRLLFPESKDHPRPASLNGSTSQLC